MRTYIALFRGINVGRSNALSMKELIALLEKLGAQDVKTYIQSGNVVLRAKEKDASKISNQIGAEIRRRRGFEPHVLFLEVAELEKAIAQNPFPEAESEPKTLHIGFLDSAPTNPNLKALGGLKTTSERFVLKHNVFYLHAPDGIGRSKLAANAERLLGVSMTDRNWRTVCKIAMLAKEYN
jgi:uncharacterized protein (DUF1697 family)